MITPRQARMARAALKWSLAKFARHAGLGTNTVMRFEQGTDSLSSTSEAIEGAFRELGVEFPDRETVRFRPR